MRSRPIIATAPIDYPKPIPIPHFPPPPRVIVLVLNGAEDQAPRAPSPHTRKEHPRCVVSYTYTEIDTAEAGAGPPPLSDPTPVPPRISPPARPPDTHPQRTSGVRSFVYLYGFRHGARRSEIVADSELEPMTRGTQTPTPPPDSPAHEDRPGCVVSYTYTDLDTAPEGLKALLTRSSNP